MTTTKADLVAFSRNETIPIDNRMRGVCRLLSGMLSCTGEDIEVCYSGDTINFYTTTKKGVKVINKILKPFFTKGTLKLVQLRTYAADPSIDYPESYLVVTEPG